MKRNVSISSLLLIALLSVGAGPSHAQTYLSGDELLSAIVGHKLGGTSAEGAEWEETYHQPKKEGQRKGKITGTEGGYPHTAPGG